MRKYKTLIKKEKEVAKTFCDWCGKESGKYGFFAGGSGEISFGFGSKRDGTIFAIDLCDDCFEKYTDKMAVRKMQEIDADISAGKRKVITEKKSDGQICQILEVVVCE